ncbi:copper homeostasis protein CutC [Rufibacter latericius]|uniref:PF03932 family protein CutC n=1 Tax=Rufibacter latericius TaxID=2487040 RepID=A0A3M9MIK3_9BACT|nr:copper homeostasis protein CutC [Rufibacter latericius]RNI24987.1 copper homeostasis protein CutC [Rufibacter latericius]
MGKSVLLEICVDSVQSAIIAQKAGAQRVELCDNLVEGGTTPSAGMIRLCRKHLTIGLHVLIRPRRGDFLYSDLEFAVMKEDIALAKELGADGVVLGILLPDGNIDVLRTRELIELTQPLSITFHRAFDLTPDPFLALEDLQRLGVHRLLTSGQKASAPEGAELIAGLQKKAGEKLIILPGGGINEQNLASLLQKTGVSEVHASARDLKESLMQFRREEVPMGGTPLPTEYALMEASPQRIAALKAVTQNLNNASAAL